MGGYIVYFDVDGLLYKLPVNPEEIKETTAMSIEKHEILKLGQIAVPAYMELREFSFETEFPHDICSYVENPDEFIGAKTFLTTLKKIRESFLPVRFVYGTDTNDSGKISRKEGDSVLVLIEELEITEKAGEEGDKYVSFKLLEYREYGKKSASIAEITSFSTGKTKAKKKKAAATKAVNPKSTGYHIVKSGDNLWTIAKKYYGDGSKCNIIFNANKDKIKNASSITIGWKLNIPTNDEFSKYSAPLPTTKAINKNYIKSDEGVSDFAAALDQYLKRK